MENQSTTRGNRFGQCWEKLESPIEAIVTAVDSDGYNSELYRVGLSAMQMRNLEIERLNEHYMDGFSVVRKLEANEKGTLDGLDYGEICIEYEGKKVNALVYNAFGKRGMDSSQIRISSTLAESLGIPHKFESCCEKVKLSKSKQ